MFETKINVGIDGTAGAGKGTISTALARIFHYRPFDAGSTYRAIAFKLDEMGITPQNFDPKIFENFDIQYEGAEVCINDENLESKIRTSRIGSLAALYSNEAEGFKPYILEWQIDFLKVSKGWVAEGRDIVPRVMPDAEVKMYFTADARERANRRYKQLKETGELKNQTYDEILINIMERDETDFSHSSAPLMRPEEAKLLKVYDHFVDSTTMKPEEQLEFVSNIIRKKISEIESSR